MNTKILFIVILLAITVYVLWPPHKTQGTNPSAEYFVTPDPYSTSNVTTVIVPNELEHVIRATQKALSAKLGKCTYCIETTTISLNGNTYSGRFLFTVLPEAGGAPYGISVDSTVEKGSFNVSNINLQSLSTIDQMDPYGEFKAGSDIQESSLPKLSDLQSAMNNL